MKRVALTSLALFTASCARTPEASPSATVASAPQKPSVTAAPQDPAHTFRSRYENPGGMWLPEQMSLKRHEEIFTGMGVQMSATALTDPLSAPLAAVVSLGGCTGSFVSPEGLIVTNHHCVQGALQLNSSEKENLVAQGFLAKSKSEERPAGPVQRVFVAQAFRDVTHEMKDGLEKIADAKARYDESEKRLKNLVSACEKDRPGIRCEVKWFFRGGRYLLIERLELRDIRLVYAPARSVGNYGGEVDNWAWPRHTGDWSFYRAYVGKDGKPADPSPDNVPYASPKFLKVSTAGLRSGDFVMVTGYPGSTSRTATASEIQHRVDWAYPYLIQSLKDRYAVVEEHLKDGGETSIKAGVAKQRIQNGLEKYEGVLAGMTKGDLLDQKKTLDRKIKEWASGAGREDYKKAIDKLEVLISHEQRTARADFDRDQVFHGSRLLSTALTLMRWAEERAKKDADRKPGYQDRDVNPAVAAQKQFAKSYDRVLDRAGFRLALTRALKLPEKDRPWLATLLGVKKVDEAAIDKALDAWYGRVRLEDEALRLELLQKGTSATIKAHEDPFLQAASRVYATYKADERKQEIESGERLLLTPYYADAMKQVLGGMLAPDANSTLRITYGTVRSLHPESSAPEHLPFTTADQILKKDTGKEPFDAPRKLLDAIRAKKFGPYADASLGGQLPVDFISDLDITGGNSGSPTLNQKGELVGLAFDGNIEGVASDVVFNPKTTRSIHVDARYMLWTMDAVDGADHLLREMGVEPKVD